MSITCERINPIEGTEKLQRAEVPVSQFRHSEAGPSSTAERRGQSQVAGSDNQSSPTQPTPYFWSHHRITQIIVVWMLFLVTRLSVRRKITSSVLRSLLIGVLVLFLSVGTTSTAQARGGNTFEAVTELLKEGAEFLGEYTGDRVEGAPNEAALGKATGNLVGGIAGAGTAKALGFGWKGQILSAYVGAKIGGKMGKNYGQMYSNVRVERILAQWKGERAPFARELQQRRAACQEEEDPASCAAGPEIVALQTKIANLYRYYCPLVAPRVRLADGTQYQCAKSDQITLAQSQTSRENTGRSLGA